MRACPSMDGLVSIRMPEGRYFGNAGNVAPGVAVSAARKGI
jgi:hypothetical protein